jgi:hypothetical protein
MAQNNYIISQSFGYSHAWFYQADILNNDAAIYTPYFPVATRYRSLEIKYIHVSYTSLGIRMDARANTMASAAYRVISFVWLGYDVDHFDVE